MWTDVAAISLFIIIIIFINRMQTGRISKMEVALEKKVSTEMCTAHYTELENDIKQHNKSTEKMLVEQVEIGKILVRLDERLKMLTDK